MTKSLGTQYIIELYGCTSSALDDLEVIEPLLKEAAILAKATIVQTCFHKFAPQGISGTIVIAESHMNLHTWPEYGYVAIDLFTCGEKLKPEAALDYLVEHLGAAKHSFEVIERGKEYAKYMPQRQSL